MAEHCAVAGAAADLPRLLVLGYGNPSRGDDALGPLFIEQGEALCSESAASYRVEFLTDFQLQVEHVLDLVGFDAVLFVDASVACREPFEYADLAAQQDESFTTHALSPRALLAVYRQVRGADPPPAALLAIRGWEFDLGHALSARAAKNLEAALRFFIGLMTAAPSSAPSSSIGCHARQTMRHYVARDTQILFASAAHHVI